MIIRNTEHGHAHGGITNRNPLTQFVTNETNSESDDVFPQQNHLNHSFENTKNSLKKAQFNHHTDNHSHGHNHGHGHGHSHGHNQSSYQMNMRGVFLHVLSDALGSVIVIFSALIFWKTDWEFRFYIDPALSILLVALILNSVWPLLRDSALILLQTVPTHIQVWL